MRGRLWKCAREQIREATNHESLGAELQTHDHLRQLLTDARSPQTPTEAVDVSAEWIREEDQDRECHSGLTSMPHSGRDSKAQGSEVDESLARSRLGLMRMDQSVATESNRPVYPPPGLDDPNHVTEHPSASTTVITGHHQFLDDDVHSLRHPQRHHSHLRTAPVVLWIWTQCQHPLHRQGAS